MGIFELHCAKWGKKIPQTKYKFNTENFILWNITISYNNLE